MIKYKDLLLYGFWEKEKSEYIVYGVNKNVLLYGVILQFSLAALYLYLVFTYSFEETLYFFCILLAGLTFFLTTLQKNIHWLNYNSITCKITEISTGFKSPEEIKGTFTMSKKKFLALTRFKEK